MSQVAIRIKGLGKRYGSGAWANRGISADLEFGRFIALIGANGAGKTTLIHLIAGVLAPTEGTVELRVEGDRRLGWCSQHQVIDWFMNVMDNVVLGARLAGLSQQESRERSAEALRLVGLGEHGGKQADQLSGGQQQRLQIARALVHDPKVLLLDEPTTGLDATASDELMERLKERTRSGAVAVVSSHDLALIESHADSILFLQDGRLLTFESRETFLRRFAGEEVLEIRYEGSLSNDCLNRIRGRALRLVSVQPLEIVAPRGMPLGDWISLLDGEVRVVDIHRRIPGLREAYLALSNPSSEREGPNV